MGKGVAYLPLYIAYLQGDLRDRKVSIIKESLNT
jgi:hypothetical protein